MSRHRRLYRILAWRRDARREVDEELDAHLALRIEDLVRPSSPSSS